MRRADAIRRAGLAALVGGGIWVIDGAIWRKDAPVVVKAVCDEAAHVGTTLLLVAPFRHVLSKRFLTGALIGSVVLDVDHLPMYAGFDILTRRTTRPYPHSLVTVAAVAGWAALGGSTKRPLALGLAVGFSSHLLRDAATGGEPLFWPWSGRTIRIGWDARRNLGESWLEVLPCRGAQI